MWNIVLHLHNLHHFSSNALHISHFRIKLSVASLILPSDCILTISNYIILIVSMDHKYTIYLRYWICGGLVLAGYQVLTKVPLSLLSSAGQRKENIVKASWIKRRKEESTHQFLSKVEEKIIGETWGKLFITNKIRVGQLEIKSNLKATCTHLPWFTLPAPHFISTRA